jgi:hypothetical protein
MRAMKLSSPKAGILGFGSLPGRRRYVGPARQVFRIPTRKDEPSMRATRRDGIPTGRLFQEHISGNVRRPAEIVFSRASFGRRHTALGLEALYVANRGQSTAARGAFGFEQKLRDTAGCLTGRLRNYVADYRAAIRRLPLGTGRMVYGLLAASVVERCQWTREHPSELMGAVELARVNLYTRRDQRRDDLRIRRRRNRHQRGRTGRMCARQNECGKD